MLTLTRILVIGASLLLMAVAPAPGARSDEFAASFCPECWKFLVRDDAVAKDGSCLTCGKVAVNIDAAELKWTWCLVHGAWHEQPCPEENYLQERPSRTALAMVVSPGDERIGASAYCPECRTQPDPMKMKLGRCPSCGGPLVSVTTLEPTWFWCSHRLHWSLEPCPGNSEKHCCAARRGTVPAKIRGRGAVGGEAAREAR